MRAAIDTNRVTDLFAGDMELDDLVSSCDLLAVPFAVLGELRAGMLGGTRIFENERTLRRFLGNPIVSVIYPTRETVEQFAMLQVQLRKQGTPIPTNDIWIAAQALEHNLTLITRDRHFERIPQLLTVR